MIIRAFALAVFAISISAILVACTEADTFGETHAFDPQASEFAGFWQTDGYGYVFELGTTGPRVFHATQSTCVEMSAEDAADAISYDHARLSEDGSVMRLSIEQVPYEYQAHRIGALPQVCLEPTVNTPMGNFEAFASNFAEHYAFFDLYGVDWSAIVAGARTQVTQEMSDQALFDLLAGMLADIEDGHVRMIAEVDGTRVLHRIGQGRTLTALSTYSDQSGSSSRQVRREFDHRYWVEGIEETLLQGEGIIAGNGRIQYGIASEGIGYLAVLSEGGFSEAGFAGSHVDDLPILDAALDNAIQLFEARGVEAVIVDVSNNYGGYDFIARAIAGHFAARRVPAYSKHAIGNSGAEPFALYIEPADGQRFTGPVYVLTSNITGSAGETLALSLRALPNVTHVGEPTKGTLSDVLVKTLPNGWVVTISNEIYTDPAGIVWEGDGIEPEIEIPVFDGESPFGGHPRAVQVLIELINQRRD